MNLHEIITKVQRVLIPHSPYLQRVCNSVWRSRLQNLSRKVLLKKFKFLISYEIVQQDITKYRVRSKYYDLIQRVS